MDDATMHIGLLMETAQTHQKLAEASLERLEAHTRGLDTVVRAAIRQALIDELRPVHHEVKRAEQALRAVRRAANWQVALLGPLFALLSVTLGYGMARWLVPSRGEIAELRETVAQLEARGGRMDLRTCGENPERLCVRVEVKAPHYGEKGDYYVIKER